MNILCNRHKSRRSPLLNGNEDYIATNNRESTLLMLGILKEK